MEIDPLLLLQENPLLLIFTVLGIGLLVGNLRLLGNPLGPTIGVLIVGLVFVARDFAQREIGHRVIVAMAIAAVLSYYMANPYVAVASVVAFVISEGADWAIYSFTGRSFADRILISSVIATPLDSAVFLYMIGHISVVGVVLMTLSKMVGALIVWHLVRTRSESSIGYERGATR